MTAGLEDLSAPVGRVARVPLASVDFRVNVLSVDGRDPLRDRTEGEHGPIFRVGMVGDIVPGRNIHLTMARYDDFQYPFRRVADRLAGFDLTIANLEGDISDTLENPVYSDPNTTDFVTGSAFLDGFAMAGIDAVTLGNNHSCFNEIGWGTQGLEDTMASLSSAGIPYFGAGHDIDEARTPFTTEIGGVSIAVLGHDAVTANLDIEQSRRLGVVAQTWGADTSSPGTNPFGLDQFLADVEAAASQYDIVIPYLHGGAEFKWVVPDWLQQAARGAIDAGATLVVTNHPHIIQGMEVYAGRPIVYSLGNFIFDQMFSVDTRQGLILDLTFDGPVLVGLRLAGVEILDFCQPRPMSGPEQAAIMDRFWRSTDRLAGR
jgi:poly-gamma-glutamate synthesis protein (capsule biosynthesis protein)